MFLNKNWNQRFLKLANEVASWSKDESKKVGAVIVNKDKQIVSLGFNGLPKNIKDDDRLKNKEWKLSCILHAEENAILNANTSIKKCTIYITHAPCAKCAALLIQSGIKRVIFPKQTKEHMAKYGHAGVLLLGEAGVIIKQLGDKHE